MRHLSDLTPCFLAGTLEHGGAERQLFYMLQAFRRSGVTPRVLSLDRGEFWEEPIKDLGVQVDWVGERPSRLGRLFRVVKEVARSRPDILQSQHFHTNTYAGLAARLLGLGGIGAIRSDGRSEMAESGQLRIWMNLHLPRTIAANSKIAIRYASSRGIPENRLHFLPNVVDTEWFKPADSAPEGPPQLIAVGRMVTLKRLDRFISIIGRLRNDLNLHVRALVVGPACRNEDLRPALESQARRLGLLGGTVEFRGGVSDMRPIYRGASVCVLTSDCEGTPNVLLEAMASGLPVVSTRVGGVPGIVRHGRTGFLFAPDDFDGLTSALVTLVQDPRLRMEMGESARAFVEESHSLKRLPVYLEELYQRVLPERRRLRASHCGAPRFDADSGKAHGVRNTGNAL